MSSMAKKTRTRRLRRQRTGGRTRKRVMNREGTTRCEKDLFGNELIKPDAKSES